MRAVAVEKERVVETPVSNFYTQEKAELVDVARSFGRRWGALPVDHVAELNRTQTTNQRINRVMEVTKLMKSPDFAGQPAYLRAEILAYARL